MILDQLITTYYIHISLTFFTNCFLDSNEVNEIRSSLKSIQILNFMIQLPLNTNNEIYPNDPSLSRQNLQIGLIQINFSYLVTILRVWKIALEFL